MNCKRLSLIFLGLLLTACAERDNSAEVVGGGGGRPTASSAGALPLLPSQLPTAFAHGQRLTSCNIETANGQSMDGIDVQVRAGQNLTLLGWLVDPAGGGHAAEWVVVFQTEAGAMFVVPFTARGSRGDLASLFPGVDVGAAGFEVKTRVPVGVSGRLSVFLAEPRGDKRRVCGVGRGLTVQAG